MKIEASGVFISSAQCLRTIQFRTKNKWPAPTCGLVAAGRFQFGNASSKLCLEKEITLLLKTNVVKTHKHEKASISKRKQA